ncbi:MAG TPA: hypothetical protein VIO61_11945 [Anaerolineaceae bacterium]
MQDKQNEPTIPILRTEDGATEPVLRNQLVDETVPIEIAPKPPKRWKRILFRIFTIMLGLGFIILTGVAGGALGYQKAIQMRKAEEASKIVSVATEQFMLGLQDQAEGRLDLAKRRFEYVIQLDPNFPGAAQKLAEVMFAMALTSTPNTPTPMPTITTTPTPDLRGEEELFNQGKSFFLKKDWNGTITTFELLRKNNVNYNAIEIDGMMYMAYRYRGVDKIIKDGNLEGGIFDMSMTERFGYLDVEANSIRVWARLYLTGSAYWGVEWDQVVNYFGQIYTALPNLRDGSGMTASERYRIGSIRYGDQLVKEENYCKAVQQYKNALSLSQEKNLLPTATEAAYRCNPPTKVPTVTSTHGIFTPTGTISVGITGTPTPTKVNGGGITSTPTLTTVPAPTKTPVPTSTPTPTPTK